MTAKYLEVDAEVRYWEDATVNGVEDTNGDLIPGRDGDSWKIFIDLSQGTIEDWPIGTTADIHYKVCDAGLYWLANDSKKRIATWNGVYVPTYFLCHGPNSNGYGDYIILKIDTDGKIIGYRKPSIDEEEWDYE